MTDTRPAYMLQPASSTGLFLIALLALYTAHAGNARAQTPAISPAQGVDTAWRQDMVVASVQYRLALANATSCPRTRPLTGMLLHDIAAYDATLRPPIEQRFGLGDKPGLRGIVAGSAAQRAGLRQDDVILSVGGQNPADAVPGPIVKKGDHRRVEALESWIAQQLNAGPQPVMVRRAGGQLTVTLVAESGCADGAVVSPGQGFDAWSDGRAIAVTSGLLETVARNDELAFIMGHELGHNWLDAAARAHAATPGNSWLRAILAMPVGRESQADLAGLAAMRRAGFDPGAAITVLETMMDHQPRQRRALMQRLALLRSSPEMVRASAAAQNTAPQ